MGRSRPYPALRWIERLLVVVEEWLPALLMAVMAVAISADVLMRYVFNRPIAGAGELSMFAMVWMVYLGSAAVSRRGAHICLDFLSDRIGGFGRVILDALVELLTITILGWVTFASFQYLQAANFLILPGTGISKQYISLALVVGLGLMVLHSIVHLIRAIAGIGDPEYRRVNVPIEEVELDDFNTRVIRAVDQELTGKAD